MRDKILGYSVAFIIGLAIGFFLFKAKSVDVSAYDAQIASYKEEIETLNAKNKSYNILEDSIPKWIKNDNEAILRELEDLQENIDYYSDIQTASPKRVDKMYDKAIKELVAKYRNGGLKP